MNYTIPYKFRLVSRNEGKIKSYESCLDVRAWNHDVCVRGGHLRAWIKNDMPFCVLPVTALATALRIMGCRSRGRVTPKCHANCKSKVLVESICASCQSIKECLKNDPKYEKYFDEEEFETCNWPCERCLDALKGVKFLWKIILEKVFRITIPKTETYPLGDRSCNVLTKAKSWKTEILHETLYVKNSMPFLDENEKVDVKTSYCQCQRNSEVTVTPHLLSAMPDDETAHAVFNRNKNPAIKSESYVVIPKLTSREPKVRVSRSISVRLKKTDVGCETCGLEEEDNQMFKNKMKQNINDLMVDLENLKKENMSLKMELQGIYKESAIKPHLNDCFSSQPTCDTLAYLPRPFEHDEQIPVFNDNVASEMIITMKNCRKSSYKQVSILQVMHKSRKPFFSTNSKTDCSCKKEDPIQVLEKLKTTFGNIVQREVNLVSNKKCSEHPSLKVKASYHNYNESVNKSLSKPSCEKKLLCVIQCDCPKEL